MSQSPLAPSPDHHEELDRYQAGWRRLVERISNGESFSGNERNCAFLNLGPGEGPRRFADISAVSGLDFPDDARGIALTDWDRDGDLDLWVSNRSSPAVRFLRNNNPEREGFLQLQLIGRTCNRDAIGARVEVTTADSSGPIHLQTVRAGDAYLSQSSKVLHFGLGKSVDTVRVSIRWPGLPDPQVLDGLEVNSRYVIEEGSDPRKSPHSPGNLPDPSEDENADGEDLQRLVASTRPLFPPIQITSGRGPAKPVVEPRQATLVNVWASWCQACRDELLDWREHVAEFQDAGLEVVAVNADQLGDLAKPGDTQAVLDGLDLPFRWGSADRAAIEFLHEVITTLTPGYRRPPVVPLSCLVDRHGQIAFVYRGPVSAKQVLADAALLSANQQEIRGALTPFPGRWAHPPLPPSSMATAGALRERSLVPLAERYLRHVIEVPGAEGPFAIRDSQRGEAAFALGSLMAEAGRWPESIQANEVATRLIPNDPRPHINLGGARYRMEEWSAAVDHFSAALALDPERTHVLANRGQAYLQLREFKAALADFEAALRLDPTSDKLRAQIALLHFQRGEDRQALTHFRELLERHPNSADVEGPIAWILATSSDDTLRDGREALRLATKWCEATNHLDPNALNTLAAAQAETGDFQGAAATIRKASLLARQQGLTSLLGPLDERLRLYLNRKPYRR